ncbi:hypothetical protein ACHAWF_016850 [Thalassiosira exigua]
MTTASQSAWSRPLRNSAGGGGGSGPRPPPGMGGRPAAGGGAAGGGGGGRGWGGRNGHHASKRPPQPPGLGSASPAAPPGGSNGAKTFGDGGGGTPSDATNALRERFLHLLLAMVGQNVEVTLTSGRVLEGVFHTFSPFRGVPEELRNKYVVKACRIVNDGEANEAGEEGDEEGGGARIEEGSTVVVSSHKVASVRAKAMRLDAPGAEKKGNPAAAASEGGFQTDSQISGGRGGGKGLVAAGSVWTSAGDGTGAGGGANGGLGALESAPPPAAGGTAGGGGRFGGGGKGADSFDWRAAARSKPEVRSAPASGSTPSGGGAVAPAGGGGGGGLEGTIGDWDQFSANEKRFNVRASFDESLYTTKLDADGVDAAEVERRRAEAARIAKEIETTATTNVHVAEERGQKVLVDYDEEDLYSGVLTKELKARVVPKAKEEERGGAKEKKATKVMNYAAAAAAAKKDVKEGAAPAKEDACAKKDGKPAKEEAAKGEGEAAAAAKPAKGTEAASSAKEDEAKGEEATKKGDAAKKEDEKKSDAAPAKSKLNPAAKEFKLSASAAAWTPGGGGGGGTPAPAAPSMPTGPEGMPGPHPGEPYPGAGGRGMPPGGMGGPGVGPPFAPMPGEFAFRLTGYLECARDAVIVHFVLVVCTQHSPMGVVPWSRRTNLRSCWHFRCAFI